MPDLDLPAPEPPNGPFARVRFRSGVVGESRRTVHLALLPAGVSDTAGLAESPGVLNALCGQIFDPGQAELLTSFGGMPCIDCLLQAPDPDDPGNTTSGIAG